MNAPVYIEVGIKSKERMDWERFRPSRTWNHTFYYETDLENYETVTSAAALDAWNYVQQEKLRGVETSTHTSVSFDNVTHPTPYGKGLEPRMKIRRDSALTELEFSSVAVLQSHLNNVIVELQDKAEY